jgi:nicotinamidase-related amidase
MKKLGRLNIFENMKEIVDPEHTALVIWDCQNGLINNIFNKEEFLANLKGLLSAARERGVPIIYTRITPLPSEYRSSWNIYQGMLRFKVDDPTKIPVFMKSGSPEAEINAEVYPLEAELVINKQSSSIFFGTNFDQLMRSRGIQTILFAGIATEIGIEHSAREASIRGFYTVVVSDCVSSNDKAMHEMALKIMARLYLVDSSGDILNEWR